MSGNRPPAAPSGPFEVAAIVRAARVRGMRVRFHPEHEGYGWVSCIDCGWGWSEDETEQADWLLDLSFYQHQPWGCSPCRSAERAESSPTT